MQEVEQGRVQRRQDVNCVNFRALSSKMFSLRETTSEIATHNCWKHRKVKSRLQRIFDQKIYFVTFSKKNLHFIDHGHPMCDFDSLRHGSKYSDGVIVTCAHLQNDKQYLDPGMATAGGVIRSV